MSLPDLTVPDSPPDPTSHDAMIAWCREQRRDGPVRFNGNQQAWELFDYVDVTRALFDPVTFSSDFSGVAPSQEDFDLFIRGDITGIDPPRHRKLRGLVSQALTPRTVAALAPRITAIAGGLLDQLEGAEQFDLVEAIADPLPIMVIAEMLGIPVADWPLLRQWSAIMLGRDEVGDDTTPEQIAQALEELAPTVREMNRYLAGHVRRCRARPGDDLTSQLIAAEVDGQRLDDEEILGFVGALLSAGHITMTSLLTSVVVLLDQHPDAAAAVRAEPGVRPGALEETMRYRPAFPQLGRRTTREVEVAGTTIPADAMVTLWVAAANRDAAKFPEPDHFDVHRKPNAHLALGHGIHFCVGAPLARLEASIVLTMLLDRYRDMAVAADRPVRFRNPWLIASAARLPMTVRPR
jgi:cytochrome P450